MPCSSSTSWTSTTASDPDLSPMAVAVAAAAVDAAVNDRDAAGDSSPIHSSSSTASRGGVLMKGKRTKRRRMLNLRELSPTPPPPATPPPALPSAAAAAAAATGKAGVKKDESIGNASPASSSSACQVITTSTPRGGGVDEEEEDLALCLMLLAQGRTDKSGGGGGASLVAPTGDEQSLLAEMQVLAASSTEPVVRKRRRRPSVLLAATSAGASGGTGVHDGVYECRTCNKRFSSFQALGGHRTSHTKPGKAGTVSGSSPSAAALEEEGAIGGKRIGTTAEPAVPDNVSTSSSSPFQLLQLVPGRGVSTMTRAPRPQRAHECSICHAEFSSGQALGGHMRRHRPLAATSATPAESTTSASTGIEEIIDTGGHHDGDDGDITTTTTTTTTKNNIAVSASTPDGTSSSTFISLDLNLPAPMEADDHSHRMKAMDALPVVMSSVSTVSASSRFPLVAGKPPVSVFGPRSSSSSSAGLVDCLPLLS